MKSWFEDWFESEEYLKVYKHRNSEEAEILVSFILSETNLPAKAKVLDLGCGAGRHALLLAKRGFEVTGVDQSANLLSVAEDEAQKNGLHITFIRDDIRTVQFQEKFKGLAAAMSPQSATNRSLRFLKKRESLRNTVQASNGYWNL